jgi:hypothetical protein
MLAGLIPDHRDEARVTHQLEDILRARVFAIACGYPDAGDLDDLRSDPAFKLACGRLPELPQAAEEYHAGYRRYGRCGARHQQLSLFNAHYDERCFLPIHVYHAESGHCVAVLPRTRITIRGDSHYGRREAMEWCDANGLQLIFGLSGNAVLASLVETTADAVRTKRAVGNLDVVRDWSELRYGAKSWSTQCRLW